MAKAKVVFFCKECGGESSKWFGQCPYCKQWNTLVEEPVAGQKQVKGVVNMASVKRVSDIGRPIAVSKIDVEGVSRIDTGMDELNRVLGGGIVGGSLVLVGGDPGIGKSTILLQMCYNLSEQGRRVLYISGEESLSQIKLRAERVGTPNDSLLIMCETNLDGVEQTLKEEKPEIVIIDSIQTMYRDEIGSAPGSVAQVRETTAVLMQLAKGLNIAVFIVGHVTKEGVVAGPRVLEHMVDTVLYFEGERNASYRILRSVKNRFGSTNEIGVFEMQENGLREVENPSEYMLSEREYAEPGSAVVCICEGTRPLMMEIQALVCDTNFGFPRRTSVGIDYNRVNLLMAVLEKRAGIHLNSSDAYVNIAGGMKVTEPAIDLGIIMAVVSSFRNIKMDDKTIVFGEVGLSGEVRGVSQPQVRINEAVKLGFETCIIPQVCLKNIKETDKIKIIGVRNIREALKYI